MKKFTWPAYIIIFSSTGLISFAASVLYGKTEGEIIRNTVIAAAFSLVLIFILILSYKLNKFDYDNSLHIYRFLAIYLAGVILSVVFPAIDKSGWSYLCVSIVLALFSNSYIGITAATGLLSLSVLLNGTSDLTTFIVYFLCSLIGIAMFQDIDKNFQVNLSIFISSLALLILETAGFVLTENKALSIEQFIMPTVNIIINILVLVGCLKYFNEAVVNKYRLKYLEINDQEFRILTELKEKSKEDYFRSIHTAYLAERIANATECDVEVAKNCAYYHRLRKAFALTDGETKSIMEQNAFPPKAIKTLMEYLDKSIGICSKEGGIVFLSDKMISSLQKLFSQSPNVKIDYGALVDTIFEKEMKGKTLEQSELTQKDIRIIKRILKEETLYYDFLR